MEERERIRAAAGHAADVGSPPPACGRLLLLELENEEFSRAIRTEILPFLVGYLRDRGFPIEWWIVGVPADRMHAGGRCTPDLPPDREAILLEAIRARCPDTILVNHPLAPGLLRAVTALVPSIRVLPQGLHIGLTAAGCDGILGDALPVAPGDSPLLVDCVEPVYERRQLFGPPPDERSQPTRLLARPFCVYQASLADNPFYRKLRTHPAVRSYRGCAFCCPLQPGQGLRFARPYLDLILGQIEAHQRAAAPTAGAFEYITEDSGLPLMLDRLIDGLEARGLRPSIFYLLMRADRILEQRERLERTLERMAASGHGLRLLSIGLENFSPDENERFNKGLTAAQIWECFDLLAGLEARFPGTFAVPDQGYFSPILVSPWTRPSDLRANLEASRRLGEGWLNRALGTRLQLREEAPVTALARAEGLVAETFDGAGDLTPICLASAEEREVPWRFADPIVARVHAILIRIDPVPVTVRYPEDDPLRLRVRRLLQVFPDRSDLPLADLCLGVLEAVEALGPSVAPEPVFERVLLRFLEGRPEEVGCLGYRDARRVVRLVQRLAAERSAVCEVVFGLEKTGRDYRVRARLVPEAGAVLDLGVERRPGGSVAGCLSVHCRAAEPAGPADVRLAGEIERSLAALLGRLIDRGSLAVGRPGAA